MGIRKFQITENNSQKLNNFLNILGSINSTGQAGLSVETHSREFLETVSGQSLCFLTSDGTAREFLPILIIGNHERILNTCFYNGDEEIIEKVLKRGQIVSTNRDENFGGDILLQELSKRMDFNAVMAAPVFCSTRSKGMFLVFGKPEIEAFCENDITLLSAFSGVFGLIWRYRNSHEKLKKRSIELDGKDFHLYTVYQVSKSLSSIMDIERLTSIIADMLVEILNVTHVIVFLADENEEKLQIKAVRFLDPSNSIPSPELIISEKNPEWLLSQNFESRILSNFEDAGFVESFPDASQTLKKLDVEAITPMIYNFKLIGFLGFGKKYLDEGFQKRDHDFISTVAPMAAGAISNARLYEMAILDGLTKVYLGRYFRQRCKEEIKRAGRYNRVLSIIMWDIDYFKMINDTYGHLAGDAVLSELAKIFRKGLRQDIDLVARYGGEEFVMLLPDTSKDGALIMAERLRRTIEELIFWQEKISITVSAGISSFPDDGTDYLSLVEQADIQLYRAKNGGRNRVCIQGLKKGEIEGKDLSDYCPI